MSIAAHNWPVLNRLLEQALALPVTERMLWLDALEGEQASLKTMLRELLTREDLIETGQFLATLPKIADGRSRIHTDIRQGEVIGAYRLERQLGIGGMGSVWLAARVDGLIKRRVALKLPHLIGAVTELAERMARERNILAALEHPNIARLYDGGVAEDGRPYLALEYVEGEPIDAYCRARDVDLRTRLGLLMQVARAVAYAHAHLVVHRDLKPSNILVDAEGQVHLLDFGIAKLLDSNVSAEAPLTLFPGTALTLEYASPEQVRGGQISTASDVYSLGVVAYELFSGTRPHKHSSEGDVLSLAQAVAEVEPPRPSDAVSDRALKRDLRGDLDTIILKALKKNPQERYATMAEFGDDLERYVSGEPVRARPDAFWYHTKKLVGRNKTLVGAVVAVVLALVIGLGVALWQAKLARSEARTSAAVEHFLEEIFRANSNAQPNPAKARETTARELLHTGAKIVDESLKDAPESRLRVLGTLADMHDALDLYDDAVALRRKGIDIARSLYGANDLRLVDMLTRLSMSMHGSVSNSDRKQVLDEAGAILDRHGDRTSLHRAKFLAELSCYYNERDPAKALDYANQAVVLMQKFPPSIDLVYALHFQAYMLNAFGRYADAESGYDHAIRVFRQIKGDPWLTLSVLSDDLSRVQFNRRKFAVAEATMRKALETTRTEEGENAENTIWAEMVLGELLVDTSRFAEGLKRSEHAYATVEKRGAADSLYLPNIASAYGEALSAVGSLQDGDRYYDRAIELFRKYRPGSGSLVAVLELQALNRVTEGEFMEARQILNDAQAIRDQTHDVTFRGDSVAAQVGLLIASNQPDQALSVLDTLQLSEEDRALHSLKLLRALLLRSEVYLALGQFQEASRIAGGIYEQTSHDPQRVYLKLYEAGAALDQAKALHVLGEHSRAAALAQEAVELDSDMYDRSRSPVLADALITLADCLIDLHHVDEARTLEAQARAIHAANKKLGPQYRQPLTALHDRLHRL